jgi:hypothetical protein
MSRDKGTVRGTGVILALVVVGLTLTCTARAVQNVLTPNASLVTYNLAAGANSGAITPPVYSPTLVMATCTTTGFRGIGHVTLMRVPGAFLEWVGLNSTAGATIAQGWSGAAGTHIVWIDFSHQVNLQVNTTDTFRVHNGAAAARGGYVTMIW